MTEADPVTAICRALGHPARRALLRSLAASECDVSNLSRAVGLDQPDASKHLASLRKAGLVEVRVEGPRRCYSLAHADVVLGVLELLHGLEARQG